MEITFEAYTERQVKEHNERAWLAYHVAVLHRVKNIQQQFRKLQITKEQLVSRKTMDEQIAGLVAYVKATGGKVIYRDG